MQTTAALSSHSRSAQPGMMATQPGSGDCQSLPSSALMQGRKAVNIVHNGMTYTLQTTKLGKLILTK